MFNLAWEDRNTSLRCYITLNTIGQGNEDTAHKYVDELFMNGLYQRGFTATIDLKCNKFGITVLSRC